MASKNQQQLSTRLVSEIMLYGLAVEGTVSTDVLIQGKLEGIRITDLTSVGKKYSNILLMGTGSGLTQETTPTTEDLAKNDLSFSIGRSLRPMNSIQLSRQFDIHLGAFIPTIQYTHSVNFVYEMELFVSAFKAYSTVVSNSFKTAAVGVAKGFVSKDSKLMVGLSKIHSSFGRSKSHEHHSFISEDFSDTEDFDGEDISINESKDRIYFDFSVQSPVIVIPSSLKKENCLVAHLGEITVSNEFIVPSRVAVSSSTASPSAVVDRLTISVSRVSLHATRDEISRHQLLSFGSEGILSPGSVKCFKVLRETSAILQVDRRLEQLDTSTSEQGEGSDLVITGKICDPLLVKLPKDVFDQIQYTIKHGIRYKPNPSPPQTKTLSEETDNSENTAGSMPTANGDPLPSVYASFSLPKLSLELKHTLEGKEKNLVYISFDGFSVQCNKREPYVMSFNLLLKSIVIEDLLQPEHSEYRYILASSFKPLPMMSPVPTPSKSLGSLSVTGSLPSLSRHFFPLSQLMSTPRPPTQPVPSPLRSFNPRSEEGLDETAADVGGSTPGGSEGGSTLGEESEVGDDLLTISAQFIDKKCPYFDTTYKSVSSMYP